jgi:hypothetical protein
MPGSRLEHKLLKTLEVHYCFQFTQELVILLARTPLQGPFVEQAFGLRPDFFSGLLKLLPPPADQMA